MNVPNDEAEAKPLRGFRAVEVGGFAAMFCGKLLADLGCDVLRIEPRGKPGLREERPLVPWNGRDVSAAWLGYNTSKQRVALDVETSGGRDKLDSLLDAADLFIAEGSPAWLTERGLRPTDARERRSRLVAVAITPFGLEGPHRDYVGGDLVLQAAGGFLYLNGDRDRPPVRISEEQVWPQAGAQAAFVAGAALFAQLTTGLGDGIDLSMQEAIVSTLVSAAPWWQLEQRIPQRSARTRFGRDVMMRQIWPCKDGFVAFRLSFGLGGSSSARNLRLVRWMDEEGVADDLMSVPWDYTSTLELTQAQVDRWQDTIERFLRSKTKAELYAGALKRRILLFPVLELPEILDDDQLAGRDFFVRFEDKHGRALRFPGALYHTATGPGPRPEPPPDLNATSPNASWRGGQRPELPLRPRAGVGGLLSGLVVADFGWAVAGPVLGRFLAHHGATVIKIESNERLDASRASPPFAGRPSRNRSGFFDQHNAGKQSVTLNLQAPEGRAIARRLALAAGVVNENFSPGVMDHLGLGYASLSAERPDLIMVSASMQGQSGPNRGHPGLGTTLQALVGLCHLTGWPDREPVGTGEPYTDTLAPWVAGTALMAALMHRQRTGEGTYIDLSQYEAAVHFLAPAMLHVQATGEPHVRNGNAGRVHAPEGVYPCAGDGRSCAISVTSNHQWQTLAGLIGFESATERQQQDRAWRLANQPSIDAAIGRWAAPRAAEDVQAELQGLSIAAYAVVTARDLFEDAQLSARGHWVARDHPAMGAHLYEMPPFRLADHAVTVARSPLIGEHTDTVLTGLLGMSADEIATARAAGALA